MQTSTLFSKILLSGLGVASLCPAFSAEKVEKDQPINVLLITADDLNCNSVGAFGGEVSNITPNIDKLATQGVRFTNAFVNVAVCQPSRGIIATGLYSHNSNIEGFFHTQKNIPTIVGTLRDNGYITGVLGKVDHSSPKADTPWDMQYDRWDLGVGRDKDIYYRRVKDFLQRAKKENKPFYLMANAHDPHRPFALSDQEKNAFKDHKIKDPSRIYQPDEVIVPEFLPEIPQVRLEVSEYFGSVKRLDDTVGKVLQALEEEGLADNTVVIFLSDHGMAFPFAKTNCYFQSNRTPWIMRWPNHIAPNTVDENNFISAVDFFPTMMDILDIDIPKGLDGKSFKNILSGKTDRTRDKVFTQFHETSAANVFPMRSVQNSEYCYIFNPWSNGERSFRNESQSGRTWRAMKAAAEKDKSIAARVDLFSHRVKEEFYDLKKDPNALNNLIDDPVYQKKIAKMRKELRAWFVQTNDPILPAFDKRDDAVFVENYVQKMQVEAKARKKNRKSMKH
ncbi:DUF229 domain-containing protein [Puteibacter caeruleilacunae]|nr:DUF229 domain-containing protein [Puteibacter caeruleilacunae]